MQLWGRGPGPPFWAFWANALGLLTLIGRRAAEMLVGVGGSEEAEELLWPTTSETVWSIPIMGRQSS